MSAIGNIMWLILGGWTAINWVLAGILMYLSVIGIPWGRSCFVIAGFGLFPFGREAISRRDIKGGDDLGTGRLGLLGNIIWFVLGGWWLALVHVAAGGFCCATIVGIPFGVQHFKLAGIALAPVGKTIVSTEVAAELRRRNRGLDQSPS